MHSIFSQSDGQTIASGASAGTQPSKLFSEQPTAGLLSLERLLGPPSSSSEPARTSLFGPSTSLFGTSPPYSVPGNREGAQRGSAPSSLFASCSTRPLSWTSSLQSARTATPHIGTFWCKYQVTPLVEVYPEGSDTGVIHCIAAMDEHCQKSLEELRWEDYSTRAKLTQKKARTVDAASQTTDLLYEEPSEAQLPVLDVCSLPPCEVLSPLPTAEVRFRTLQDPSVAVLLDLPLRCSVEAACAALRTALCLSPSRQLMLYRDGKRLTHRCEWTQGDEVEYGLLSPAQESVAPVELIPKLTLPGYSTSPPLADIARMTTQELRTLRHFCVENEWGRLEFTGPVDVTAIDVHALVRIEPQALVLYPGLAADSRCRPKGIGSAVRVRLFHCSAGQLSLEAAELKMKRLCQRLGATFEAYSAESEELVFGLSEL